MRNSLRASAAFSSADVVLFYAALPDEVPTDFIGAEWGSSKQLLLPTVVGEELVIKPFCLGQTMCRGALGIAEPIGVPFEPLSAIQLVLVPGLAFDDRGYRLGRGRGYYDRFLAHPALSNVLKIGIAFDFQRVDVVPTEAHDIPLDGVIWV